MRLATRCLWAVGESHLQSDTQSQNLRSKPREPDQVATPSAGAIVPPGTRINAGFAVFGRLRLFVQKSQFFRTSTPADLAATTPKRSAGVGSRAKVAAKYRHPGSGATWSGRGLKPKWLTEQLANGKQVSDFAI